MIARIPLKRDEPSHHGPRRRLGAAGAAMFGLYDTDCKAGEICSGTHRCDRIAGDAPPAEESGPAAPTPAGSAEPGPGGAAGHAPADREAYVARCKDNAACIAGCGN